jgi:hypothetical protein
MLLRQVFDPVLHISRAVDVDLDLVLSGRSIAIRRRRRVHDCGNVALPEELRAAGYDLREDGEGQRIPAAAIVESFIRRVATAKLGQPAI